MKSITMDVETFSEKKSNSRKPPLMWSDRDTHKLLLCYIGFPNDWKKIAEYFSDRTPAQIYYRYQYVTSKLTTPASLYVPLETVDFTDVYLDLQNS
jgi:hypothetical protein